MPLINKSSGMLDLAEEAFPPHMDIDEFKTTKAGSKSKLLVENAPWQSYRINPLEDVAFVFYFCERSLQEIHLAIIKNSTESWATWSMEEESKRKTRHDEFLRDMLGPPPYAFSWGGVSSVLDTKSGSASVIIRYSG
jgi:hypothetical protein